MGLSPTLMFKTNCDNQLTYSVKSLNGRTTSGIVHDVDELWGLLVLFDIDESSPIQWGTFPPLSTTTISVPVGNLITWDCSHVLVGTSRKDIEVLPIKSFQQSYARYGISTEEGYIIKCFASITEAKEFQLKEGIRADTTIVEI